MGYSGVLGRPLGSFVLGDVDSTVIILGMLLTQDAIEFIHNSDAGVFVTQVAYELLSSPNPNLIMTQDSMEVLYVKPPSVNLTQYVTEVVDSHNPNLMVTQDAVEVIDSYNPTGRLTSIVAETITTYDAFLRVTQGSIEVLYQNIGSKEKFLTSAIHVSQILAHSSIINRTIVTHVHVTPTVGGGSYSHTITSNIHVTSTVSQYQPVKHASVTSNVHVTSTPRAAQTYSLTVTSAIDVTQDIKVYDSINRQTVTSNVTVHSLPTRIGRTVQLTVTSHISVGQTIRPNNQTVELSVQTNVGVTQIIFARNTVVRISVMSHVGTAQVSTEHNDHDRQHIESDIHVASLIAFRNTNVREMVLSTLTILPILTARSDVIHKSLLTAVHVQPIIVYFNPNVSLETFVHANQIIGVRNTVVRLGVTTHVTVSQKVRHSPNLQTVTSNIAVDGSTFGTAIKMYVSPLNYKFVDGVFLTQTIAGGSSNRKITVETPVSVGQIIRTNFNYQRLTQHINVGQAIVAGKSIRELTVQSNITVTQTIVARDAIVHLSLRHQIDVDHTIIATTREIPLDVANSVIVDSQVSFRILSIQKVHSDIGVTQSILVRPDNNRQFVTSHIGVTQHIRSSPNYQTIVSTVNVSSRIKQLDQTIVSRIHVDQSVNLTYNRLIIQKVPITQVLEVSRDVKRTVVSEIKATQTIRAGHIYVRNIVQKLIIPDTGYLLPLSFDPNPIIVPVAIGVIVNATLMSMRTTLGSIVLPPALLGDAIENIGKMEVKKSMDGTRFSYVQAVDRQKLIYKWKLSHLKIYELRAFIKTNMSSLITMENWKGEIWMVKIVSNPFAFENQGVYKLDEEFAEVSIEFEGRKLGT